jgi:hypothetical protein
MLNNKPGRFRVEHPPSPRAPSLLASSPMLHSLLGKLHLHLNTIEIDYNNEARLHATKAASDYN